MHEIRFVLGSSIRNEESIVNICNAIKTIRLPALIRNDTPLKTQTNKANPEIHNRTIDIISSILKVPIKLAGNINNFKTIIQCRKAKKFAVSLSQAKTIIKEYSNQPADELRKMLYDE